MFKSAHMSILLNHTVFISTVNCTGAQASGPMHARVCVCVCDASLVGKARPV